MNTNRSMPPAVIIPELPYPDVREAVDWLCRVFGFRERLRIGSHRAQLQLGEGSPVVTQGGSSNPSFSVMVRVDDLHTHHEQVAKAGAHIINAPTDYPYGERQYVAEDIGGHRWTFSQTLSDVDPATWGRRVLWWLLRDSQLTIQPSLSFLCGRHHATRDHSTRETPSTDRRC